MRAPARPKSFEKVRRTITSSSRGQVDDGLAAVLEVRLVDDERPGLW